jgi:hypothetical protein
MNVQGNLAFETATIEQSNMKRKTTCSPTSHSAANARTTTHRYLLNNKIAVKASIDWTSSEEESDAAAFFRTIAGRLIGIH